MTFFSRPVSYVWKWELGASPIELWPLVADTDRFNRDTGLPMLTDARAPGEALGPGRHRLKMRLAGVPIEWEESPFEWVAPSRFGVVRRYGRGPLREMTVQVELEALATARTLLTYRVQVWPRGIIGAASARLQIGFLGRRSFGRVFELYAKGASQSHAEVGDDQGLPSTPSVGASSTLSPEAASRLRALITRLGELGHGRGLRERLARLLEEGHDLDLTRIRPYTLADEWRTDRRATLKLLLHAALEGILDLRWDVICPLCHGADEGTDALQRLPAGKVHCDSCMIDFESDLERGVELAFVPAARIRELQSGEFCVAGPRTTPHVFVQQLLAPGEVRELTPLLAPGRYQARTLSGKDGAFFDVVGDAGGVLSVAVEANGALRASPAVVGLSARVNLANQTDTEQLVLLELSGWGQDSATAAEVLVLQEFRDLFSREVLAAGRAAAVGTLTVLFTDLKGSTAMYKSLGDGPAFDRVVDHFRLLREAIEPERGSVVKTIGDAVMAVFSEPAGGLRAMLRAHRSLSQSSDAPSLVLKAALHAGPCIAVTLNERIDYFGSTVNVAARLAGLSEGADVVMSDRVRKDPGVAALLASEDVVVEAFRSPLQGVEGEAMLWRVRASTESGPDEHSPSATGGDP